MIGDEGPTFKINVAYFCYIHHVNEVLRKTSYTACFECQHIFQTEADLLAMYNEKAASVGGELIIDGNKIPFCPCCDHGWLA